MNAQQLEFVRISLRSALLDTSGGTKGQLEAFAENPPADKSYHPRQHIHMVELDNGRGGVRRVKAENTALYVLETRSRRRPLPPINDSEFSSCVWRRAVMKLDKSHQAWVKYCYGFDLDYRYQTEICKYIWETFAAGLPDKKIQERKRKKLIALTWLAAQDNAAKNSNESFKERAAAVLARLMDVAYSTWSEVYAEPWDKMKQIAERLDANALKSVYRNVMAEIDSKIV